MMAITRLGEQVLEKLAKAKDKDFEAMRQAFGVKGSDSTSKALPFDPSKAKPIYDFHAFKKKKSPLTGAAIGAAVGGSHPLWLRNGKYTVGGSAITRSAVGAVLGALAGSIPAYRTNRRIERARKNPTSIMITG